MRTSAIKVTSVMCGRIPFLGAQKINEIREIAGEFFDLHRTMTHCGRRRLSILRDAEDHV
jgi:hypothetical protein